MPKRSGKFYSKNEKQTLKALGLTPAPASGAGWVVKEDGENETLMVQLKSTDALSYRISRLDMKKLEYHAEVSNKVPVFLVQFLKENRLYAIVDVNSINDLFYGLKGIKPNEPIVKANKSNSIKNTYINKPMIKTNKSSRDKFFLEQEKRFKKR